MIGTIRISQIPPASPLSGSEDFIVNQSGATRLTSLDNVVGFVSFVPSSGISSYSDVAGISTFANVAGISTYSGVAGISTVSGGLTGTPNISVGIITATSLIASGIVSAMSGFNLGISSVGVAITNGPIKTLNFIGAGNTFSVDGNVVNISITSSTNISYASTTRTLNSSTGIGTQLPLVTSSSAGLQRARGYGTIAYAATVTLDMAALNGQVNSISLTDALVLATSNLAIGQEVELRLVGDGTQRTLTFPTDWKFQGTKPANLPANKVARLSLQVFGTTNASVDAVCTIQS